MMSALLMTISLMSTLAETECLAVRLGQPRHHSVLLHSARALGLRKAEDFTQLAYQRGCLYYTPPEWTPSRQVCPSFSKESLAIALLHPCLPYDPHRLRIAAAMVAAPAVNPQRLAHLAVQERAADIVRFIGEAGHHCEPDQPFWTQLLHALPASRKPLTIGVMPHPSRFTAMTGRTGPGHRVITQTWIRPIVV
jgi:hypothetical protein